MLADKYQERTLPAEFQPAGTLDRDALPCVSRDAVLDLIENGLAEFAGRSELRSIKNEKGITNRLCKILNCHKLIYFHHEGMQDEESGTSPTVDLEAVTTRETIFEARLYSKEESLMAIEAKRLPSPPPKPREREYLVGSNKGSGGLERFKLGVHGKNALAWVMLGYVQRYDFSSWFARVNGWIDELAKGHQQQPGLVWEASEKLEIISQRFTTARYRSQSKRSLHGRMATIEVIHLWVLLTE